jgi:AcrR family transcriptional regulator
MYVRVRNTGDNRHHYLSTHRMSTKEILSADNLPPQKRPPAQLLLESASRALLDQGMGDGSLRTMATRIGTSHRMLIYHFGSADGFWNAVLTHLRENELFQGNDLSLVDHTALSDAIVRAWDQFSAPQYLPVIELMFELYGRAIRDRAKYREFLDHVVMQWLNPLSHAFEQSLPISREQAQVRARLTLAAMRGLLLDLITTGDRRCTTAAIELLAASMVRVD